MNNEEIKIDGYTVVVVPDDSPSFPLTHPHPPGLTFSLERGRSYWKRYGLESFDELTRLIPPEKWERHSRVESIRALGFSLREVAEVKREGFSTSAAVDKLIANNWEQLFDPQYWAWAEETVRRLEAIAQLAGLRFCSERSQGYSQGDEALTFFVATQGWTEQECRMAASIWGHWAWGDVYGIEKIISPEGRELEDGSCWEFYGHDHEESGLLPHARDSIEHDKKRQAKERREREFWEARGVETV